MSSVTSATSSVPVLEDGAPQAKGARARLESIVLPVCAVIAVVAVWDAAVHWRVVSPTFVATPAHTLQDLLRLLGTGQLWTDLRVSGEELVLGVGISFLAGTIGGLLYGWYPRAKMTLSPLVNGWNAIPHVALIPVIILIFGIGISSKVVLIVAMDVTTFWLNAAAGIENIERKFVTLSKSFSLSDATFLHVVALPATVPYIIAALRLGVGRGIVAVVVAELYGARFGIGHLLTVSASNFAIGTTFAALVIVTLIALVLNFVLTRVERTVAAWRY